MPTSNEQKSWSVAQHDTIPAVDLWLNPLDAHTYLFAFLDAEGTAFAPPYTPVRTAVTRIVDQSKARDRKGQAPSGDVADQRLRTWKSVFESFGLLLVDETGTIRLSPFGRALKLAYAQINDKIEGANDHIAKLAVSVLNRQALRNPLDGVNYPEDANVRPFRLIWKAMRQLDDRLHWEEVNRVLMHVLYEKDEAAAIDHIRQVRKQAGSIYNAATLRQLGDPAVSQGAETKRRVTPWFSRAGFGGLLISADDDENGFRILSAKYRNLIDDELEKNLTVPSSALVSPAAYLTFITEEPRITEEPSTEKEEAAVSKVVEAMLRYGHNKIICLSGLPATGKTYIAKLAATRVAEGDPYRFEEIQFHESTSYDDFMEGFVPKPSGEGFELKPKVFRVINRRARLDPAEKKYVLLIEEFTRANIHSVIGELLTYIEHRNRPFRLATSQEEERVAPNLVVLATLNPRDKSAVVLDQAIIRRLYRIDFDPSVEVLRSMLHGRLNASVLDRLAAWFQKFLPILPFGHGMFVDIESENDLKNLWHGTLKYYVSDFSGAVRDIYKALEEEFPWK
jgi:hypothetical protein